MQSWKQYFEEFLRQEESETNEEELKRTKYKSNSVNRGKITEEELKATLKKLRNGKALGHDQIGPEPENT